MVREFSGKKKAGLQAHASAAKSAVDSLTRSLALEWGEFGIRTNGIAPGIVAGTPGTAFEIASQSHNKAEVLLGISCHAERCWKWATGEKK